MILHSQHWFGIPYPSTSSLTKVCVPNRLVYHWHTPSAQLLHSTWSSSALSYGIWCPSLSPTLRDSLATYDYLSLQWISPLFASGLGFPLQAVWAFAPSEPSNPCIRSLTHAPWSQARPLLVLMHQFRYMVAWMNRLDIHQEENSVVGYWIVEQHQVPLLV